MRDIMRKTVKELKERESELRKSGVLMTNKIPESGAPFVSFCFL